MSILTVGIDVSRQKLDVAIAHEKQDAILLGQYTNDESGFVRLAQALRQAAGEAAIHIVMEPTGGYEQPLAHMALDENWRVSLPNPRHVRDWARSQGRRAKTDRQDALLLARYGVAHELPAWQPVPTQVAALESLLDRRTELQEMARQEKNRRHALQAQNAFTGPVAASIDAAIAWLEQAIADIDAAIEQHMDKHPDLRQAAERLRTVPGIGPRNVLPILILLCHWANLTAYLGSARGLTAFVGMDPQPYQSGTSLQRTASISRQGSADLRSLLFMSALGGTHGKNVLRAFYQRLLAAGKPKKVALVAAAHKILVWAWAVFRTQSTFDPKLAGEK
jgi:transposase